MQLCVDETALTPSYIVRNKCGEAACFQFASLLASRRRPISAVVTADLCSICEKMNRPCGIERLIASFKLNRS